MFKIKDNIVNAVCIFCIVTAICFMLTVILKSFYGHEIDISFIKDIFSIGATLAAALIAISLFNDWKEQHNKTILAPEALKIYRDLETDIMTLSTHRSTIRNRINSPVPSESGQEVLTSLSAILEMREKRIVELMFFSTLTKNNEIRNQTMKYSTVITQYHTSLNPVFDNPQGKIISNEILNNSYIFTKNTVDIIYELKSLISDYILIK